MPDKTTSPASSKRPTPEHAPLRFRANPHGELLISQQPVSRVAAQAGQTPFYAYSREIMQDTLHGLRAQLPSTIKVHYAVKANPMPAVVHWLAQRVDGLDVASAGELRVALDAGMNPQHISFAGPGKTADELEQAVAAGVLINLESFREVSLLAEIQQETGWTARVAVRINPDFELKQAGMKMGGGPKPFGVDAEEVPSLLTTIGMAGLAFEGFHIFCGAQNLNPAAIIEAQQKSYELALSLREYLPAPLLSLNLGGGFGIPYFPGEQRLDLAPIATNLAELQQRARQDFPQAELTLELGRYLVGEAGVYVCQVIDRKISRGQVYLVTNGGLHHHLAASGNFGQIIRKNYPTAIANRMTAPRDETPCVVGPLCTPLDLLADRLPLATAQPGDLVAIFQSGAYGASASPQRFLGHPACLEL